MESSDSHYTTSQHILIWFDVIWFEVIWFGVALFSVQGTQQHPQVRHLPPRVLEDEGVVFGRTAKKVRCPHHGYVLQTHLGFLNVVRIHKLLETRRGRREKMTCYHTFILLSALTFKNLTK